MLSRQLEENREGGLRSQGDIKRGGVGEPLISVITVVYNGVEYIEQAIQSVITQSYDNVEYIIIDGGSTDGSLDVIKKYNDVVDYWVSESDQGVYDAMNKGVGLSRGDYVLFLGCDDTLFNVFHEVVTFFSTNTTSYYGNVILSKSNKVYGGKFHPLKLFYKNIPHQAIFYSRYVFDRFSFNLKYIAVADYALNLKVFPKKEYGFRYVPKIIAKYNNEDGLSSTVVDQAFSLDKPVLIKKYYSVFYYTIYRLVRFVVKRK